MKLAVFGTRPYDRESLEEANARHGHDLTFLEARLTQESRSLASEYEGVCVFVNDQVDATVIETLAAGSTRTIALRCAGYNNVDVAAANKRGISVVRVPAYSPHAVAEHTVALILALNRQIHRAYARVREGNFELNGLMGFDLHGRTAGIVGTGKIGTIVARILNGFGCKLLAHDVVPNPECEAIGVRYVTAAELLRESDILTLHCPLLPDTYHLIDEEALKLVKSGAMLINTSRGALIDTRAVIAALKSGQLGYLGLDVYEEEADVFFRDLSNKVIEDDVLARLLTFPNVLVTGHQAFFTRTAMQQIATTTLSNVSDIESGRPCANEVTPQMAGVR